MESYNFFPQSSSVQGLLNACLAILPLVQEPEKSVLINAMREFELFGCPTLWSASDVDSEDTHGLTEGEKRDAICRFLEGYDLKEQDWIAIDGYARGVLAERIIHIGVEFDPLYTGGDYDGVAQLVFIPLSLIQEFASQSSDGDDGVDLAFTKVTKLDSMHIVSYKLDEHYNQNGELVES